MFEVLRHVYTSFSLALVLKLSPKWSQNFSLHTTANVYWIAPLVPVQGPLSPLPPRPLSPRWPHGPRGHEGVGDEDHLGRLRLLLLLPPARRRRLVHLLHPVDGSKSGVCISEALISLSYDLGRKKYLRSKIFIPVSCGLHK